MTTLKLLILYSSYLSFPFLLWMLKRRNYFFVFLSLVFIYARFIEPKIIMVNHYKIETGFKATYALIADIHLGVYNDESILKRAVKKINQQKIDALLIAGDFTYEPKIEELEKLFAPLKDIKVPIFVVLGNHDKQKPGPKLDNALIAVLEKLGVNVIDNKSVKLNDITILGLGSHWAKEDNIELLEQYNKNDNLVVLTHNPDTTLNYPDNHVADITMVGHTHGGQVRIPWLYHYVIPVRGVVPWNQGEYNYKHHKVFVTSGIGVIGLPLRFLVPPTIDIIELY